MQATQPNSKLSNQTSCLFCRIIASEIPAVCVAESDDAVAIFDVVPQAPVHILILPRRHIDSLEAATDPSALGGVLQLAQQVARAHGIAATGYRCVINTGLDGGQSIGHLHLHLLGGRSMGWPPG
jgi:histidine triad (HIT) family protein